MQDLSGQIRGNRATCRDPDMWRKFRCDDRLQEEGTNGLHPITSCASHLPPRAVRVYLYLCSFLMRPCFFCSGESGSLHAVPVSFRCLRGSSVDSATMKGEITRRNVGMETGGEML